MSRRWWLLFTVGAALGLIGSSSAGAVESGASTSRLCAPAQTGVAVQGYFPDFTGRCR